MELNDESNRQAEGLQLRLEVFVNFSWMSINRLECVFKIATLSPAYSALVLETGPA